jgi:hypothetical protein
MAPTRFVAAEHEDAAALLDPVDLEQELRHDALHGAATAAAREGEGVRLVEEHDAGRGLAGLGEDLGDRALRRPEVLATAGARRARG